MAPCDSVVYLPVGFKFHPTDDEILGYYLLNKVRGSTFMDENVVPEIDLYGHIEPWEIWNEHGGQKLQKGEDLYFFTKLKKVSDKDSRVARTIGSGTWKGENRGTKVCDPRNKTRKLGLWKRFHYENTKSDQHVCWIMHEYTLDPLLVKPKSNSSADEDDQLVFCRFRKNDKKRRLSVAEDHGDGDTPAESRNKVQRQLVTRFDELVGNSTPMSEVNEVVPQYGQQKEQTTPTISGVSATHLPTGLSDQPHYFVTQKEFSVADPTMLPSLPRPDSQIDQLSDIACGITEETCGQFGSAELNVLDFQADNDDVLNFQLDDDILDLIRFDDDDVLQSFTVLSSMGMGMENTTATTKANGSNDVSVCYAIKI